MARKVLNQLDLNSNKIVNLGTPTAGTDATTKTYVDGKEVPLTFDSPLVRTVNTVDLVPNVDFAFSVSQTVTVSDAATTALSAVLTLGHNTSGAPGIGFGNFIDFLGESSTTINQRMGRIHLRWTDATHATRSAKMTFTTVLSGVEGDSLVLFPSGGAAFNGAADPAANNIGLPAGGILKIGGNDWITPAFTHDLPANPAGQTSAVGVMAGCGERFTPTSSGRVLVICTGRIQTATALAFALFQLRYGTGTSPVAGAAAAGTPTGGNQYSANGFAANVFSPIATHGVASGLTVGTSYWFDLQFGANSGAAALANLTFSIIEL